MKHPDLLRRGAFPAANGTARSAVFAFRTGGDWELLSIALTIHAVTLAAVREPVAAQKALDEASVLLRRLPAEHASMVDDMLRIHRMVRAEIARGVPNPTRFVAEFLSLQAAPLRM